MSEGALYLPFLKKFIAWPVDFNVQRFAAKHNLQVTPGSIQKNGHLVTFVSPFKLETRSAGSFSEVCELGCHACGKNLKNGLKIIKAPVENWTELLDCWACHKEAFAVSSQASFLNPKDGVAFQIGDSLIMKSESCFCTFCGAQLGFKDENGIVKFFISKVTLNGMHSRGEKILIEKLEAAKDMHSIHSFRVLDSRGNSFCLKVTSWDSVIFMLDPVPVILCSLHPEAKDGEVITLFDHDFDNVLSSMRNNMILNGLCYFRTN